MSSISKTQISSPCAQINNKEKMLSSILKGEISSNTLLALKTVAGVAFAALTYMYIFKTDPKIQEARIHFAKHPFKDEILVELSEIIKNCQTGCSCCVPRFPLDDLDMSRKENIIAKAAWSFYFPEDTKTKEIIEKGEQYIQSEPKEYQKDILYSSEGFSLIKQYFAKSR